MIQDVPCVIMRGGTSKGVFVKEADIAGIMQNDKRDEFILKLFGSPDPRQIDGLGGADMLTSKFCLIGSPTVEGADVNYTFAQVGIEEAKLNYTINCGNLSAAVAFFAIEEGFIEPVEPITKVNIYNTNTKRILIGHVPVFNGKPLIYGDFTIDGVPGTGAKIDMDYALTTGARTGGGLLPTGNAVDELYVPELDRKIKMSIVDIANLCVFFDINEIGLNGTEKPDQFNLELLQKYRAIRKSVALLLDLGEHSFVPFTIGIQSPKTYENIKGDVVNENDFDISARHVGSTTLKVHKAFPGTGGTCLAVACGIEGSLPYDMSSGRALLNHEIKIGHPSGINTVAVKMKDQAEAAVESVIFPRTARRIMQGTTYIKW